MSQAPVTCPTLLLRLRDAHDQDAWAQFVAIYAPVVFGFARTKGLQEADAADLTQDVLQAVSQAMPRLQYDPERGSFRGWLFTVVRNKLRDAHPRRAVQLAAPSDTDVVNQLHELPAPQADEEALWRQEYRQRLFNWAAEQVRSVVEDSAWQAFWQTAVEGKKAAVVAHELGMSVAAVYMTKSRVLARIKETLQNVQGDDDDD